MITQIKKYSKFLIAIAIIIGLFSLYFNFKSCVSKRTVSSIDTTAAYIAKIEQKNNVLANNNIALNKQKDSICVILATLQKKNIEIRYVYIQKIESANKLNLRGSDKLIDEYLPDTIAFVLGQKNDTICKISVRDVKVINDAFLTNEYLAGDTINLCSQIFQLKSKDSVNSNIIINYKKIVENDTLIYSAQNKEIGTLTNSLSVMTKKYKRQKLEKFVIKGIGGAIILWLAIK